MSYESQPLSKALFHPIKRFYNSTLFMALLVAGLVLTGYIIGIALTN